MQDFLNGKNNNMASLYDITMAVSNKEYIENIHITHGRIQLRQLRSKLADEGKWQPSFTRIVKDVIKKCSSCQPKRVRSIKPQSTLAMVMDFNEIISVDGGR